jgi:hypothetical protein
VAAARNENSRGGGNGDPRLRGRDQAAARAIPAEQQEAGGGVVRLWGGATAIDANMSLWRNRPHLQIIRSTRSGEVIEQDLC